MTVIAQDDHLTAGVWAACALTRVNHLADLTICCQIEITTAMSRHA